MNATATDVLLSQEYGSKATVLDIYNESAQQQNSSCNLDLEIITAQSEIYFGVLPILLISCFFAMIVNVIVIASACWIRCPMTPNLKISLSLAAADATSSTMYGLLVLIIDYNFNLGAMPLVIELLRLSGIVITVVHLLALSVNHYIGIRKPLHYNQIVTSKKVCVVICLLWICPFITVVSLCLAFDREGTMKSSFIYNMYLEQTFMDKFSFRISYSSLFFIPIFIMVICYANILFVVRKQQNKWNNLSRVGSTRTKGKPNVTKERKQLEGNVRAMFTTLLILGSCFIGWTPALLFYNLTCIKGCYIEGSDLDELNCNHTHLIMVLRLMDNILVILKMLANPIIYSIRMREIKDGTHRMLLAITGIFCKSRRDALKQSGFYYRSRMMHNNSGSGTMQGRMTSLKQSRNGSQLVGKDEDTFL